MVVSGRLEDTWVVAQTGILADGLTGRQTDSQTDKQADTGRQTDRQAGRHAGMQAGRHVDSQTDIQADIGRQADRQTDRQLGRNTDRQTCRHAGGQGSRKADRHTDSGADCQYPPAGLCGSDLVYSCLGAPHIIQCVVAVRCRWATLVTPERSNLPAHTFGNWVVYKNPYPTRVV